MKKEIIIPVPKIIQNNSIFEKNKYFICSCCDIPYKSNSLYIKKNKCEFCNFHGFSNKTTIAFTFKQFLAQTKIIKTNFYEIFVKILNKYKFIFINWENLLFFINFKNIEIKNIKNYLFLFFEEIHQILNIEKNYNIKKDVFSKTYVSAIESFEKRRKRPFGKKIIMPFFNNKTLNNLYKRELINSKNLLV